jgi:hypothetical protein
LFEELPFSLDLQDGLYTLIIKPQNFEIHTKSNIQNKGNIYYDNDLTVLAVAGALISLALRHPCRLVYHIIAWQISIKCHDLLKVHIFLVTTTMLHNFTTMVVHNWYSINHHNAILP